MTCSGTHCVTCADEGTPMRVVEPGDVGLAWCTDDRARVEVMTGLVDPVRPGDVLLVHAGTALTVLSRAPAPVPEEAGEVAPSRSRSSAAARPRSSAPAASSASASPEPSTAEAP